MKTFLLISAGLCSFFCAFDIIFGAYLCANKMPFPGIMLFFAGLLMGRAVVISAKAIKNLKDL